MSEFISQLALGIFGGLERTLLQKYKFLLQNRLFGLQALFCARRSMSNLRAFLGSLNIVYRVHFARFASYRVHIARSLKNIVHGCSRCFGVLRNSTRIFGLKFPIWVYFLLHLPSGLQDWQIARFYLCRRLQVVGKNEWFLSGSSAFSNMDGGNYRRYKYNH